MVQRRRCSMSSIALHRDGALRENFGVGLLGIVSCFTTFGTRPWENAIAALGMDCFV
ncbi:hypothetical protein FF011L_34250 [Roseimaritima multifibrata]|uniref:Uncharacterized protein n=1 Tax=Roseimaritima multifibrata TaxID=1930274 RepID=A0A517MID7_9BACT|nr:hypothetical protein FF011L_34250 [Roseimaritima multifibrata]